MNKPTHIKLSRKDVNIVSGKILELRAENKQLRGMNVALVADKKASDDRVRDCERVLKCFISRGDHIEPSHVICLDFARDLFKR